MKDILLDSGGDLLIENGDFVIGESDTEHIKAILSANKGEFKEFPALGAAIEDMINDDNFTSFLIGAKKNLQYDGVQVRNISFTADGKLNIDAKYINNG